MNSFLSQAMKPNVDLNKALMKTRILVEKYSSCQLAPDASLLTSNFFFNPCDNTLNVNEDSEIRSDISMTPAEAPNSIPIPTTSKSPAVIDRDINLIIGRSNLQVERANLEVRKAQVEAQILQHRVETERLKAMAIRQSEQLARKTYEAKGILDWSCKHCGKQKQNHYGTDKTLCMVIFS